jgi:hypothetical protein
MALLPFSVIEQYFYGNYHRMALNYSGKYFITLALGGKIKYISNLL